MAHPTERARQRAKAVSDLRESCARLAARFGVDAPQIPERYPKDPSHLMTLQMQAVSGFLDAILPESDQNAVLFAELEYMRRKAESKSVLAESLTEEIAKLRAEREGMPPQSDKPKTSAPKTPRTRKPTQGRAPASA